MRLFTVAGIDVHLDWSLLIIFALVLVTLGSGLFPTWHPQWGPLTSWLTALAAAVLFFGSVLLHELSHAIVGRRNGIEVRRITLFVFGGMAQIEHEPGRWSAEFWMAIVGPFTSLLIGVICLVLVGATAPLGEPATSAAMLDLLARLGPAQTLLMWLGQVNVILAIFNLVPAFPLDGGRVLRAALWRFSGDLRKATRWASALGQAFAWLLIFAGLMMILGMRIPFFGAGPVNGIWLAFIGWFLNNAAHMSYRQLLTREALQGVPVSRVMLTRFDAVAPDLPLDTLIEDYALRSSQRAFPVVQDDQLVGMVSLQDLQNVERERRHALTVRDVMKPIASIAALAPGDDALDALKLLGERDVGQAPVLEEGRVAGLVRREDILRWLNFQDRAMSRT